MVNELILHVCIWLSTAQIQKWGEYEKRDIRETIFISGSAYMG